MFRRIFALPRAATTTMTGSSMLRQQCHPMSSSAAAAYQTPPQGLEEKEKAVFVAAVTQDWESPEHLKHNGILMRRPLSADVHQEWVNEAGRRQLFGAEEDIQVTVPNPASSGSRADLTERMDEALERALENLSQFPSFTDLPQGLSEQISSDVRTLGRAVGLLCTQCPILTVQVELIGSNMCRRWHRDYNIGRAIVSYAGSKGGTMYTDYGNVNQDQFLGGGENEAIIRDEKDVKQVAVGDILFIKGQQFPEGETGLVHKSAEVEYDKSGELVYRMVLKIDAPAPREY